VARAGAIPLLFFIWVMPSLVTERVCKTCAIAAGSVRFTDSPPSYGVLRNSRVREDEIEPTPLHIKLTLAEQHMLASITTS